MKRASIAILVTLTACPDPSAGDYPTVWGETLPACCYDADQRDTADDTGQAGPELVGPVGPRLGVSPAPL